MLKKTSKLLILVFISFSFDACTSTKALTSEKTIEEKNNNVDSVIDKTKLDAIEDIKRQILSQKSNMSNLSNLGDKQTDPFLHLYRGLRND